MAQSEKFLEFDPIYLGRERLGTPPPGSDSIALSDRRENRTLPARIWQVATRDPKPYEHLLQDRKLLLIHAHFGVDATYALTLSSRLKIPLVTTFHGFDATTSPLSLVRSGKPSWINYLRFRGELARSGELFICVSNFIRQRVIALGFPSSKTIVHYMGIDTASIRPRNEECNSYPTVLHVARLVEKKGTTVLISAFAQVSTSIPTAELVIVGEGPLKHALRDLAKKLGILEKIKFLGSRPHSEVLAVMARSWVLCQPSLTASSGDSEGLPTVVLEAAAKGLPVVATHHGGIPEAIVDGETGYLCAEHDTAALAERLKQILTDSTIRRRMGTSARTFVAKHFDQAAQSATLENLYSSLL